MSHISALKATPKVNCPEIDYIILKNKCSMGVKILIENIMNTTASNLESLGMQTRSGLFIKTIDILDTPSIEIVLYAYVQSITIRIDKNKLSEYNELIKVHYKTTGFINIEDFLHMAFMNYTPDIEYKKSSYLLFPSKKGAIQIDIYKDSTILDLALIDFNKW